MQHVNSERNRDNVWIISFRKLDANPAFAEMPCQGKHSNPAVEMETTHVQNGNHRFIRFPCQENIVMWIAIFVVMSLAVGFINGFGALFIDIMEEYGTSRADTAVVQSLHSSLFLISGIISGTIVTRFGPRKAGIAGGIILSLSVAASYFASKITILYCTAGALPGFGTGLIYISSTTAIGFYFTHKKNRSLAFSVASGSGGVGGFVYPYLSRYLLETYSLQESFLILGGLLLNCVPFIFLLTRHSSCASKQTHGEKSTDNMEEVIKQSSQYDTKWYQMILILMKNTPYILFVIAIMCSISPFSVFYIIVTDIVNQKGLGKADGSLVISVMSIVSLAGRLAPGLLMQIPKFHVLYNQILCSAIGVLFMVSVNFTTSLTGTLVVTSGVGIYRGMVMTLLPMTTMSLVGQQFYSTAVGLVNTLCGLCNLALGPLSGFAKDVTGTYDVVLYGLSALIMCGFLLFCVVLWRSRREEENN